MLTSHSDSESQLPQELSIPLLSQEEQKEQKERGLTIRSLSLEETEDNFKEELSPASEEEDNHSSHFNPSDEEKDPSPESIQFLNQDNALEFLEQLGINLNNIPNSEEFLSFLRQLLRIEQSPCRSRLRWAHIDSILERVLQIPLINRSAISLNPTVQNQFCTSRTGLQGCSIPLQNSFVMKEVLFVRNLLRGIEMTAFTAIHYFFYGLLGYHLYQLLSTGRTNFNELQQALFNVSYNGLVNLVQSLAQLPPDVLKGLLASTATPTVLLTANGLFQSDNFSEEAFNVKLNEAEPKESGSLFYTELWQWLPIFPVSNKLQDIERLLRWEGRLSSEQKLKGYELLERIALTGEKHIQRTAMECLAKLAHSFHVRELALLKEEGYSQEALLDYLTIKQRALKTLQQLTQFKKESSRFAQMIRVSSANYMLWWLGFSSSRFSQLFYYLVKSTKIIFEIILLINFIEIIQQALNCPKQPGFEFGEGFAPWAGDYTVKCFTARLRLFRNGDLTESMDQFIAEISNYHLNELTTLDLSHKALTNNDLIKIINAVINEGAQITELILDNRGIISSSLSPNLFANLPQLQQLDLSYNQFTTISPEAFANLPQLQTLNLENNKLTAIPTNAFANLTQLQFLHLYNNKLTAIFTNAFANLPHLQFLSLGGNQLTAISTNTFGNWPQLQSLDLSVNRLTIIPTAAFANLTQLQYLNLGWNQLTAIPTEALTNLPQLQSLDLSQNQLSVIPTAAFTNLPQLQSLYLSENHQLTAISTKAFANLSQLQYLDLSSNPLTTISIEALTNLPQLKTLYLDANQLTTIPTEAFANLPQLQFLDLSWNRITAISSKTFANLPQLQGLGLDGNRLTAIPTEALANLPQLQSLYLNWNQLTGIPEKAFIHLPQLQQLTLQGNFIRSIAANALINIYLNGSLDLSAQNLNDEAIYNLTQCLPKGITSLILRENNITQQGAEILADILPCTNITYIDLSNNPANFTNFNRLTQENTLRQMCESQRCKGIWPDQTSCPVSKPTDKSSSYQQTKRWTLFGSIRDTVSNVFNKTFDSFCNMLGEHARDVVSSCPSYFDPHAAEKMAAGKPFKPYWNPSFFNQSKANLASNATSTNYINTSLLGRP